SAYSTTFFGTTLPAVNDALDALAETSSALSGALETQRLLEAQTGLVIDQLDATMDTAASPVAEPDRLFAGLESELGIVYNDVLAFGTSDALSRLVGEGGL
ncbi:YhgE/Pip domain-containing protein, partial [Adlercreutzia rubneri]|nr:YhgE/Pip domain-containing protein [Adlercreutzia rubneri]